TGPIGCIMNVISSCSFACTAAFIYKKKHNLSGAVIGLISGCGVMLIVMLLWNYLITPIYMGYPREAVAELLLPAFLPFNLIKGGLNAAFTMLLYKPIVTALRRSHLIEGEAGSGKAKINIGIILVSLLVIATCVLFVLSLKGII
ncbi:MAG: ECF transporter S component, partial [Lachnospiraceae bacterium]|nr:ECF transporter S component [Lachnospiraceae bacterium]